MLFKLCVHNRKISPIISLDFSNEFILIYQRMLVKKSWLTSTSELHLAHRRISTITSVGKIANSTRTQSTSPEVESIRSTNYSPLHRLVQTYRDHGHRLARLNPLISNNNIMENRDLRMTTMDLEKYGLSENDQSLYNLRGVLNGGPEEAQLNQILDILRRTYCGPIGFEFSHLLEAEERQWFAEMAESLQYKVKLSTEEKKQLAVNMLKSQIFDNFVATKFPTVKRYGGEGAESMIAFFEKLFQDAAQYGIEQIVICIPHRGRLNLLTTLLEYPPVNLFRKMNGLNEFPDGTVATGDVLSHLTNSVDLQMETGNRKIHVTMLPNPSHLEAVNAVAVGKTRGRQMTLRNKKNFQSVYQNDVLNLQEKHKVLCLQVHGDAAVAAQGIVMETLALSQAAHFTTGGSVHLIVNNQIGFTTQADQARSSPYCSDIAKMIHAPVIHVNADFPEEVVKATAMAVEYRKKFAKDVFVDLVCFRRWGHNEMDDPTFTNPKMYETIRNRSSIPDNYVKTLLEEGVLTQEEITSVVSGHNKFLSDNYEKINSHKPDDTIPKGLWTGVMRPLQVITTWDTGMDTSLLSYIGRKSVEVPNYFTMHPHLEKTYVQNRITKLESGTNLDWATAESLAIGSILYQGYDVRISGQDVGRGTFSHRHAILVDQTTGKQYIPLNNIADDQQGFFEVANSILSEEAVLGFEYGMSVENPRRLVIWEAQFGDFFNGAQIIVDTFISSGETKWLLQSGLVMLLPHGLDGAGPEHSSCRIERFLQMSDSKEDGIDGDDVNIQVVNPTTPAQYFHVLRKQMVRNFRKPLIVASPKLLLRLSAATSDIADFAPGKTFSPVLADHRGEAIASNIKRLIFCSGKHYYSLIKYRDEIGINDTAIIRLEALCPFPAAELQTEVKKYPNATTFVWSQEEPQNMGPWSFVLPRFRNLIGLKIVYSGRRTMAAPAVGIRKLHQEEMKHIVPHPFTIIT